MTAIAGHSEEVERKYYLGRVRSGDVERITGGAEQPEELQALWAKLPAAERERLLAELRSRQIGR